MDIRRVGNSELPLTASIRSGESKKTEKSPAVIGDSFVRQRQDDSIKLLLNSMVKGKGRVLPGIKTKQFADSHGRVTHLALMMSSYAMGSIRSQMLESYKTLFSKMEPDTKFSVVVASNRDKADVERVIKEGNIPNPERIQFIQPKSSNLTVWARDMMVPMFLPDEPDKTALLEQSPFHNWHGNDSIVPEEIAKANPSILLDREPRLITDGGEVMANTRESFIGQYSIAATAKKMARAVRSDPQLKQDVIKHYENSFSKQVVVSKGENIFPYKFIPTEYPMEVHKHNFQMVSNPDYHEPVLKEGQVSEATMYEDLAAKLFEEQFGKPLTVLGKDLPETAHKEEPATDHLDMGLTPIDDHTFFLGDPRLVDRVFSEMTPEEMTQASEKLSEMQGEPVDVKSFVQRNRDNPEDFDAYEKTLKQKGYNVIRLPHSEPKWRGPYISYNNCLMERFDKDGQEVRRVFLPVYGIKKLDDFAVNAFKEQGFEVHELKLDALAARWGAIRCSSNWLDRSPRA